MYFHTANDEKQIFWSKSFVLWICKLNYSHVLTILSE